MMVLSTSASSGLMTRSRSASVLDGAICSSGTSSPVPGSRYWTRLWWLSWTSSSARMPVARRISTVAQAQNARSSPAVRLRRVPLAGSSAQTLTAPGLVTERTRSVPAAVKALPGLVAWAACSSAWASACCWAVERTRAGRTGSRSRVRVSIRDLRCRWTLPWMVSARPTGQGTAHCAHRAGSSTAHWARSR